MGEFLFDWNDLNLDSSMNGIPIPRSQYTQPYSRNERPGFSSYQPYDHDCPSPRPPLVPPNSLVTSFGGGGLSLSSQMNYINEQQRPTFSPINAGSPFTTNSNFDMDVEIKMEPFDDLLDVYMINTNSDPIPPREDNLLDNVNFDDLLMTDDLESTTCLDPQHSSPAAMATVHPDDVLGITRNDVSNSSSGHTFTPSISVPVKSEHYSFGIGGISSFPPQGFGWKEPSQSLSFPTDTVHPKQVSSHPPRISQSGFNLQNLSEQIDQQPFSSNDSAFTNVEGSSTSALHDLLVNSPSSSHSNQLSPDADVSPVRNVAVQEVAFGQSVPGPSNFLSSLSSRLSSSAPVNDFSFDKIWQRQEPRHHHMLSTGSLFRLEGGDGSTSSLSTGGGILSPLPNDLSIDEEIDSDDESDIEHYDSDSDDNDYALSEEVSSGGNNAKKERHFWQYNVQAKGPKGQRVSIIKNETNPYELDTITDPVFSPMCSVQGIKHSGKARRGDGNDLTPSPRKLVSIGLELGKLNKKINDMTPVSELPSIVRSKSRKEKNKLASRACRLKKKAQHEANKIKLYGLEQEHRALLNIISKVRDDLANKVEVGASPGSAFPGSGDTNSHLQQQFSNQIEKAMKFRFKQRIAGHTTEFVNKVIEKCRNGNPSGGLEEIAMLFSKANLSPVGEGFSTSGIFPTGDFPEGDFYT